MAIKVASSGGGPTPTIDTTDLVSDSELLAHTSDSTGVHGITDTSVLATTTVTDALDARVDTLEAAQGVAVVREWINVLNYSVDPNGNTDSAAGLQAAFDAAKASIGGRTMGTVFIPKGRYKCLSALNAESIILQGEGNEASQLWCPNELGAGTFFITFQTTQTAAKKYSGPRDIQVQGPNINSGLGAYPANMDGVRLGNAGLVRGCDIRGFRAALNLFKDHENIEHSSLTGGIGVMFDKTQSGGDQMFTEVTFSGCLVAAVGIHPDSNIGGANFTKCHMGFCPVPVLKFDVQGASAAHLGNVAPAMYDVAFTATTTNGSSSITGITGVTTGPGWGSAGAIANGMRVVGTGIPAGAKIASFNSGAGTFSIQDAISGSAVNATASGAVTMYAGVMQVESMAACTFTGCSFESYGNALVYNQPNGIKGERIAYRDCLASNAMDSNTRVSGWPATACVNNAPVKGWIFENSEALLKVGSASVFLTGTGDVSSQANLGELASTIDAVNTAGLKLLSFSSAPNLTGTRFRYASGGQGGAIEGDLTTLGGTVAVGDLLSWSGTSSIRHNGTAPTSGVAMQAGVSADRVPRATTGSISINVHSSNSALFASANKWVKPDTVNAGYVVEASSAVDGDVIGKTTAVQSSSKVTVALRGIR